MEQPTTPAQPKPLTDAQQKAIAQQVVADWRKECPYHLWNDRLDDLGSRAVEAGAGKDFGALLVTAEEYNKLIDGYVGAQTHWNAVHREAKRDQFKAASMFVHGGVTITRQPAGITLPEFIEGVMEDIKINLASDVLAGDRARLTQDARREWDVWRRNHPHATVFQSLSELIAIYKRFDADDVPIFLAADTYKEVVRAVSAHEGRSPFWERTATLCEGFIYAQRHFIRGGSEEAPAAKPDPVEPNPIPIMHIVEMQPLPLPTHLKTVMDEIVALPMVSDKAFNQLLERFIADMRAARVKGETMKLYQYGREGDPPHVFDLDHIVAVLMPHGDDKEILTVHTTSGVLTFDCGDKDQAAKMHQDLWFRWAAREAELAYADNVRNKFFVAATQVCESLEKAREEEAKRYG